MPAPAKPSGAAPPAAPPSPPPATPPAAPPAAPAPSAAAPSQAPPENPFAELDAKFAQANQPTPTTTGTPPAGTPPAGTPPAGTPPAGTPHAAKTEPKGPKELRAEYDRLKGELDNRNKAYSDLEKRIADAEKKGKDTTVLSQRLEAMEKQIQQRDAELRALKAESDPAFKEKWDKPFEQASAYARQVIEQLQITDAETGQPRQATFDDFVQIYRLPHGKAIAVAKEKFGDAYQLVINHMTELQRMEYNRNLALKEEREKAQERQQAEEAERAANNERLTTAWATLNQELQSSVEGYKDPDDDKELVDLRQEGYRIFDQPTQTTQQRLIKNAHIRQRVAAYGPNQLRIARLNKQVADLTAELDAIKNPNPNPNPRRPGGQAQPSGSGESWEEGARKAITS